MGQRSEPEPLLRCLLEKREYASDPYLTHLADRDENLSGYGMSDTDRRPPSPRRRAAARDNGGCTTRHDRRHGSGH